MKVSHVIVLIFMLLAFLFLVDFDVEDHGQKLDFEFSLLVPEAHQLKMGMPVHLRGVEIGKISRIEVTAKEVRVDLKLFKNYEIPKDSEFKLKEMGLMGEMLMDIMPSANGEIIKNSEVIQTEFAKLVSIKKVIEKLSGNLQK